MKILRETLRLSLLHKCSLTVLYEMCKKAMISKNYKELDEAIKQKLPPYLYNGGEGEWIHCAHIACIREI